MGAHYTDSIHLGSAAATAEQFSQHFHSFLRVEVRLTLRDAPRPGKSLRRTSRKLCRALGRGHHFGHVAVAVKGDIGPGGDHRLGALRASGR